MGNDTVSNTGQKAPTPSPLRASNTLETLRPKEVNVAPEWLQKAMPQVLEEVKNFLEPVQETDSLPLQGRGLPPVDYEYDSAGHPHKVKNVQETDLFAEPEQPEKYNVLPVDWPTATKTMGLPEEFLDFPLEKRVTRLEEQVDGLLDRLAKFSIRSGHKI